MDFLNFYKKAMKDIVVEGTELRSSKVIYCYWIVINLVTSQNDVTRPSYCK